MCVLAVASNEDNSVVLDCADNPHADVAHKKPGKDGEEGAEPDEGSVDSAYDKMCKRNKDAWKTGKRDRKGSK